MPEASSATSNYLSNAQQFLAQESIPGWLVYDYRQSNPIFWQLITPSGHVTRPCFLHIPAAAQPELEPGRGYRTRDLRGFTTAYSRQTLCQ